MNQKVRAQLLLLEQELTAATRPVLERIPGTQLHGWGHEGFWFPERRYAVLGWPRVSNPQLVREWLGHDTIVPSHGDGCVQYDEPGCIDCGCCEWPKGCEGTLSDPEACSQVLTWIPYILAGNPRVPPAGTDEAVAEYLNRIWDRVLAPETVMDIVRDYLIEHGYDGLYEQHMKPGLEETGGCTCDLDDLMSCCDCVIGCHPGVKEQSPDIPRYIVPRKGD